ncbi:MAG: sulfite exporter TauE/SafE family protein [Desulfurivibrio sp.]|nr:sulfite exporter TauE/SafE family protein [Desulfurivibrio sp.]
MFEPLYLMAFTTALLGSGHCLGMCGPVVAAFALNEPLQRGGYRVGWVFHLFYSIGRLLTYTAIGGVVGWFGSVLAYTQNLAWLTALALIFSDLFVIVVGLATAGAFSRLNVMRFNFPAPTVLLTRLLTALRGLPPALRALPIGLLLGFLPCGFLYAMFIAAGQSADPLRGAITMLFFGLGTVPALLLFGTTASWLSGRARGRMLRAAGIMVVLIGLYNLYGHLQMFDWVLAGIPFVGEICH